MACVFRLCTGTWSVCLSLRIWGFTVNLVSVWPSRDIKNFQKVRVVYGFGSRTRSSTKVFFFKTEMGTLAYSALRLMAEHRIVFSPYLFKRSFKTALNLLGLFIVRNYEVRYAASNCDYGQ